MINLPDEVKGERFYKIFTGITPESNIRCGVLCGIERSPVDIVNPRFSILYLINGNGIFVDDKDNEYQLKPGNCVFRHPYMKHSVFRSKGEEWIEVAITFSFELYNKLVGLQIIDPEQIVIYPGIDQLFFDRIYSFINRLGEYKPKSFPSVIIEVQTILNEFNLRSEMKNDEDYLEEPIEKACEILSEDLDKKLLIPDCAKRVGLGYHLFRKEFRKRIGLSPKEYRIRQRIEAAQQIMRQDLLSLKEIVEELGYPDYATFAKQYKKVCGVAPAASMKEEE